MSVLDWRHTLVAFGREEKQKFLDRSLQIDVPCIGLIPWLWDLWWIMDEFLMYYGISEAVLEGLSRLFSVGAS